MKRKIIICAAMGIMLLGMCAALSKSSICSVAAEQIAPEDVVADLILKSSVLVNEFNAETDERREDFVKLQWDIETNVTDEDFVFRYKILDSENQEIVYNGRCHNAESDTELEYEWWPEGDYIMQLYVTKGQDDAVEWILLDSEKFSIDYKEREYPLNPMVNWSGEKKSGFKTTFGDLEEHVREIILNGISRRIFTDAGEQVIEGEISYRDSRGDMVEKDSELATGVYTIVYTLEETSVHFYETAESKLAVYYEESDPAKKYAGMCGENIQWYVDLDGILHINGHGPMLDEYEIQKYTDEYEISSIQMQGNITTISEGMFEGLGKATEVVIPDTVEVIGDRAFYDCRELEEIDLPESLKVIGESAFAGCAMKQITIPKGVTEIDNSTFAWCSYLDEVEFLGDITEIGERAFDDTALKTISLPESVLHVGDYAFAYCDDMEEIEISGGLKTIGEKVFDDCRLLKEVKLPEGLVSIGKGAFSNCFALEEMSLPESLIDVGAELFYKCTSLETVKLPKTMKTIPESMFYGCSSLEDVVLPETLEIIEKSAFEMCGKITQLEFPQKLSKIDTKAFSLCTGLEKITFSDHDITIGDEGFYGCRALKKIEFSEQAVTTLYKHVFFNCGSLLNLDFENAKIEKKPEEVTAPYRFAECVNLRTVRLPKELKEIGNNDFFKCSGLVSIRLPETVETIGHYAFGNCNNLVMIEIPKSVSLIQPGSFGEKFGNRETIFFCYKDSYAHQFAESINQPYYLLDASGSLKDVKTEIDGTTAVLSWEKPENGEVVKYEVYANDLYYVVTDNAIVLDGLRKNEYYNVKVVALDEEGNALSVAAANFMIEPGAEVTVSEWFEDVYKEEWYVEYVQYVFSKQLMSGNRGTLNFNPQGNVTKAQVAQVLYNMANQPKISLPNQKVFQELGDVVYNEWYAKAVAWAYGKKIITGDLNTRRFYPNANVTREEMALMLYRYAEYCRYDTEHETSFEGLRNVDKVSDWAWEGVEWAVGAGMLSGIETAGEKDLAPQETATRAQMAAILQRFDKMYR